MKKTLFILSFLTLLALFSCKKNGIGGESEISVTVKHHVDLIPGATVYIKYGAKEFPGEDLSKYDDSKVTGTSGQGTAHTHFSGLLKGNYYLYAVGYDSSVAKAVKGGIPVKLKSSHEHVDIDVPVSDIH